jgi:hypothetical protein
VCACTSRSEPSWAESNVLLVFLQSRVSCEYTFSRTTEWFYFGPSVCQWFCLVCLWKTNGVFVWCLYLVDWEKERKKTESKLAPQAEFSSLLTSIDHSFEWSSWWSHPSWVNTFNT